MCERWCVSLHCIAGARRSHVAPFRTDSTPPPRMWRGSGKLVWLALAGWLTRLARSHSRPPDKILLLQNQPTSRQGITCCLLLLWEPDFLVGLFFLDSLCFDTSLDSRDFFKSLLIIIISIISIIVQSANALNVCFFLEAILCFIIFGKNVGG